MWLRGSLEWPFPSDMAFAVGFLFICRQPRSISKTRTWMASKVMSGSSSANKFLELIMSLMQGPQVPTQDVIILGTCSCP